MFVRELMAALVMIGGSALPSVAQTFVPTAVYVEPRELVTIEDGARRLNLYCVGSGSPTVMLEAGAGNGMMTWRHVQAEVGKLTRVCAYDRAGLGFSDAATRPSDVRNLVDDLHSLLKAADIPTPIVFVGHSLGGQVGVLFAATYPSLVGAMVLVDPGFAGMLQALQAELPPGQRTAIVDALNQTLDAMRACLDLARKGALTQPTTKEAKACVDPSSNPDKLDDTLRLAVARLLALPRVWETEISEIETFVPKGDQPDVNSTEFNGVDLSFGDKPLVVLSRGKLEGPPGVPPAYVVRVDAAWKAGHDRLAALSSGGSNTVVSGAGHYIQIDRPDAVINAVRRTVMELRTK
jgi:pimeloyl-ACP methyl ester carboxylesterase